MNAWAKWIEAYRLGAVLYMTGLPFTYQHIDDFTFARETFRMTPTFKWD